MCLYSRLVPNPKYRPNKKNGWNPPPVLHDGVKYVPIGCKKCIECRKRKSRDWLVRLTEDIKHNPQAKMITLTFSNQSIIHLNSYINPDLTGYQRDNAIATQAMRWFNERWRKKYTTALRHWMVTELGHNGTENIHLHGIVWTDDAKFKTLKDIWKYGFIWDGETKCGKKFNYVNGRTINYIVKYVHKIDQKHKYYESLILSSPGVGKQYKNTYNSTLNKFIEGNTNESYRTASGHKIAMPIYWRNHLYSEEEREKLWIEKIEKKERWVCGTKVDISKTDKEYYRLLDFHRKRNTQLGYGNDEKDWNQEQYEKQRRAMMLKARTTTASGGPTGGRSAGVIQGYIGLGGTEETNLRMPAEGAGKENLAEAELTYKKIKKDLEMKNKIITFNTKTNQWEEKITSRSHTTN